MDQKIVLYNNLLYSGLTNGKPISYFQWFNIKIGDEEESVIFTRLLLAQVIYEFAAIRIQQSNPEYTVDRVTYLGVVIPRDTRIDVKDGSTLEVTMKRI